MCEEKYSLPQIIFVAALALSLGCACTFLAVSDHIGETEAKNAKLHSDNVQLVDVVQSYEEPVNKLRDMGMSEMMVTKYINDGCVPYFDIVSGRR